jgi:hypothetical protein
MSAPKVPPLHLKAATYWTGIIAGASSRVAAERYDPVQNVEDDNTNSYTLRPKSTFGTFKKTKSRCRRI